MMTFTKIGMAVVGLNLNLTYAIQTDGTDGNKLLRRNSSHGKELAVDVGDDAEDVAAVDSGDSSCFSKYAKVLFVGGALATVGILGTVGFSNQSPAAVFGDAHESHENRILSAESHLIGAQPIYTRVVAGGEWYPANRDDRDDRDVPMILISDHTRTHAARSWVEANADEAGVGRKKALADLGCDNSGNFRDAVLNCDTLTNIFNQPTNRNRACVHRKTNPLLQCEAGTTCEFDDSYNVWRCVNVDEIGQQQEGEIQRLDGGN